MATIRKRGKRWQAVVRTGDQPAQYKSFKTKGEAGKWATSVEDAINKDEFVPNPEAKRRTVTDMLERYRKTVLPGKQDHKNAERHLDFWIEKTGTVKLSRVTRAMIVEIRDDMTRERRPGTVNRYLATLRHAFRIASTDWEWSNKNPCQRIMLTEPRGRQRHLNDDEIKAMLDASKAHPHPHIYTMVLIALTTGARRGEITGLRWPDIDLNARRALLKHTKNSERRMLALVPQVITELKALNKVRRIDTDLVFASPNPQGKRTFTNFDAAWRDIRDKADLTDFRFHDLRHTFASRMAMNGKTLNEIAEALGHKTLAMVQRYAHLTQHHIQTAMEETGRRILGDG